MVHSINIMESDEIYIGGHCDDLDTSTSNSSTLAAIPSNDGLDTSEQRYLNTNKHLGTWIRVASSDSALESINRVPVTLKLLKQVRQLECSPVKANSNDSRYKTTNGIRQHRPRTRSARLLASSSKSSAIKNARDKTTNFRRKSVFFGLILILCVSLHVQPNACNSLESHLEETESISSGNSLLNYNQEHQDIFSSAPTQVQQANSSLIPEEQTSSSTESSFITRITSFFSNKHQATTTTTTTTTQPPSTSPYENLDPSGREEPDEEEAADPSEDQDDSGFRRNDDDAEGCAGISADDNPEAKNLTDNERLVNLQTCFQRKIKRGLKDAARNGMEVFDKLSLSGGCSASLLSLMAGASELKSFAFEFLDASAKIPSGMMYGLLSDYGDFDQCLSIRSNPNVDIDKEVEEGSFSGKYCLMSVKLKYHVKIPSNRTAPEGIIEDGVLWNELFRHYWTSDVAKGFQIGMCFPSRCTNDDLDQIYQYVTKKFNVIGEIISCQDSHDLKRQYQPDLIQSCILYTFYILIILTIIGTMIDRYYERKYYHLNSIDESCCSEGKALLIKTLVCFSIIKNWRMFMRRKEHINNNQSFMTNSNISLDSDSSSITNLRDRSKSGRQFEQTVGTSFEVETDESSIETPNIKRVRFSSNKFSNQSQTVEIKCSNDGSDLSRTKRSPLAHLSGLRLLVIIWITVGYSFLYPSANNYQYYRSIIKMNITRDSVWFAATNFTLGIDMLLYITGLVFVYKLANHHQRDQHQHKNRDDMMSLKIDHDEDDFDRGSSDSSIRKEISEDGLMKLMIKRILRFWPTYLSVIALAIMLPMLSDGPMWPEMVSKRIGESCRRNWWSNLLFINNYLNQSDICLPSSWFISILMQLFLVGSFIIMLVRAISLFIGLSVLALMLGGSIVVSFCYAYFFNVRAPMIKMDESFVMDLDENIFRLYTNLFNNLGPFLIGMLGGFILIKTKIDKRECGKKSTKDDHGLFGLSSKHLSWFHEIITGLIVASIAILVLSSVFHQDYTPICGAIYWCLHRIGWAIVTGYIVHNCATGRWGFINDLLSLSTLIPISRLIFIAYLVYPMFIHIHSGLVRDGLHVSIYNMLNIYITRLVMTFVTAIIIHLLVELPFCSIEEIYLSRWVHKINCRVENDNNNSKLHPLLTVDPTIILDDCGKSSSKIEQSILVTNKGTQKSENQLNPDSRVMQV